MLTSAALTSGACNQDIPDTCAAAGVVCGADGVTYDEPAAVAGVAVVGNGERETTGGCGCTSLYAPMCGADGAWNIDACEHRCAGVSLVADELCFDCECPDVVR